MGFGFGLVVFDFEDLNVEPFLSDDRVEFLEEDIGVHVLVGIEVFDSVDFHGVDVFSGGKITKLICVHGFEFEWGFLCTDEEVNCFLS